MHTSSRESLATIAGAVGCEDAHPAKYVSVLAIGEQGVLPISIQLILNLFAVLLIGHV
jgi:hypothetical protein